MNNNTNTIIIKCKDKDVECNAKLRNFSQLFLESNEHEPIEVLATSNILMKVLKFYEAYDFSLDNLRKEEIAKPIRSDKLKETIGETNIKLLQDYILNESEVKVEEIRELLTFLYEFNFIEMRDVVLKAIGTQFYCGPTDTEIENYKKKFQIPDDIPPEEQLQIMTEDFKDVFDKLNAKLIEELEKAENTTND